MAYIDPYEDLRRQLPESSGDAASPPPPPFLPSPPLPPLPPLPPNAHADVGPRPYGAPPHAPPPTSGHHGGPAGEPSLLVDGRAHLLAPTRSRIQAGLIDFIVYRLVLLLLAVLWVVLGLLHSARGDVLTSPPTPIVVLYVAFTLLFFGPATWRAGGQSVGKRLLGLRVVQADGSPLRLPAALLRETLFRAAPLIILPLHTIPSLFDLVLFGVGVGCVLYGADQDGRRTVWDRVSGTIVVLHDGEPLVTRDRAH